MSVTWAAIAIVGIICLLNLLLTVAVIRRLREHTELINRTGQQFPEQQDLTRQPGAQVDEFRVTTVDDRALTRDDLRDGMLVAFFSPRCPSCEEQKPAFLDYAGAMPGGRENVVAVVLGSPEEVAGLVAQLEQVAQIVLEANVDGAMSSAFDLRGYPAFCLMGQDAVLAATGYRVDMLPEAATR
ncbi:redoxin domain-containing protein [Micromonospora chokoriensis]|uniref:AhpC/TSA family protein n=1 Tax=Micromonospora chokoriensis TaxID=356851 RepID=A0A1C4WZZ8_9ACTN|nr:redoxin domain-containing protein [Micromonospora chokoriensis]SCF01451.1 AhpC/TSA family protein [Micromonospora chokoriensis]